LSDVMPLIRFGTLTMAEVAEFVAPAEVLNAEQLIEVFTYLADNRSKISFSTQPRQRFQLELLNAPLSERSYGSLTDRDVINSDPKRVKQTHRNDTFKAKKEMF